jgi:putative nucleotidyltransferase with HDIG domain
MKNMVGKKPDIVAGQRIEQAIVQYLDKSGLSILPEAASRFITQMARMELTPASLGELLESDPSLTALALRLCLEKGIAISPQPHVGSLTWTQQMLGGITLREIRDAVLSAKIYGGLAEDAKTTFRRELTRHCVAAACCAELLAKQASPPIESTSAYLAGLLHDIGKFLLDEVMPKSFDELLEQARGEKAAFCEVERKNLGLDHAILGKRFAQRMRLGGDVILGVWLHHSHTSGTPGLSESIPQARIAGIVELADCIVRRLGIGESGNYADDSPESLADPMGFTAEQIIQVQQQLPDIIRQKSEIAGLTLLRPGWAYCDALRAITSQLTAESAKLSEESVRLQSSASHFDFVKELLPNVSSTMTTLEAAECFAANWQRFFQTGPVCVYLAGPGGFDPSTALGAGKLTTGGAKSIEAVIVENQAKAKTAVFEVPEDVNLIPESTGDKFTVRDASDSVGWLLEQSDVKFEFARTKAAPLVSGGRTVGVIVFELRHPVEGDLSERLAPAAGVGAVLLDMFESIGREQWYAERFAQLLTAGGQRTEDGRRRTENREQMVEAEVLAEMAAGAAHELNNPLSVIRGRAQLLAGSENDVDKKRMLEQIQQNVGEISAIIDDLMSYASPAAPRPSEIAIGEIIDEAVDLADRKTSLSRADIKIEVQPDTPNVFVDSAQIDIAISNIICNALESYDEGSRPLAIQASGDKSKPSVTIQVIDSGQGMDAQTLAKATQPFFSAKPAGRKRGMGLAHAQRLINLNGGTLSIASQPGKGTTVMVELPCK